MNSPFRGFGAANDKTHRRKFQPAEGLKMQGFRNLDGESSALFRLGNASPGKTFGRKGRRLPLSEALPETGNSRSSNSWGPAARARAGNRWGNWRGASQVGAAWSGVLPRRGTLGFSPQAGHRGPKCWRWFACKTGANGPCLAIQHIEHSRRVPQRGGGFLNPVEEHSGYGRARGGSPDLAGAWSGPSWRGRFRPRLGVPDCWPNNEDRGGHPAGPAEAGGPIVHCRPRVNFPTSNRGCRGPGPDSACDFQGGLGGPESL